MTSHIHFNTVLEMVTKLSVAGDGSDQIFGHLHLSIIRRVTSISQAEVEMLGPFCASIVAMNDVRYPWGYHVIVNVHGHNKFIYFSDYIIH